MHCCSMHLFVQVFPQTSAAISPHSNQICMAKRWNHPEESHSNDYLCLYVNMWLSKRRHQVALQKINQWLWGLDKASDLPATVSTQSDASIWAPQRAVFGQCCIDHLSLQGRNMAKKINHAYVVYNQISEENYAWLRRKKESPDTLMLYGKTAVKKQSGG